MKAKIILTLTFLLINFNLFGQISIEYSDMASNGDGFIYAVKKFEKPILNISQIEKNGYNLKSITHETYDTVRFYPKTRTRYGKFFENAEDVMFFSRRSMQYIKHNEEKMEVHGLIDDYLGLKAAVVLIFPKPLTRYEYPLTLGKEIKDSLSQKFLSGYGLQDFADSIRMNIDIKTYSIFDTIITLETPSGSYQVLREKNIEKKVIVANVNDKMWGWRPAPQYSARQTLVTYRFFAKKGGIPIAEIFCTEDGTVKKIRYQYKESMSISLEKTDINCKGKATGEITVNIKGGTPDFKYLWNTGQKTKTIKDLKAGEYSVTVTDSKGNRESAHAIITEPDEELKLKVDYQDITCKGRADGKLSANISGGTKPYYVVWSNDTESTELTNQMSGVYGVIVRDAARCFIWDSVTLTQPELSLDIKPELHHVSCKGGNNAEIIFNAKGGQMPYNFFIEENKVDSIAKNLTAGTYKASIVDSRNCKIERQFVIYQPEKEINIEANIKEVTCSENSGQIITKTSGGAGPYKYLWSDSTTNKDILQAHKGKYTLALTDFNKCTVEKTFEVTGPDNLLSATYSKNDVTCRHGQDGQIELKVVGGNPPYKFNWSNKANTQNLIGLKAGVYTCTISDQNNCSIAINVTITEPENGIDLYLEKTDIDCPGYATGIIEAKAENGEAPYTFMIGEKTYQSSKIENLLAGTYTVICKDKTGCTEQKQITIKEPEDKIVISAKVSHISCYGEKDGQIELTATGGTPNYEFTFKNLNNLKTDLAENLSKGIYEIECEDTYGCKAFEKIEIKEPPVLEVELIVTNSDKDKNNGSIITNPKGGTPPYYIHYQDGNQDFKRTQMKPKLYTIHIKDKNDCRWDEDVEIK